MGKYVAMRAIDMISIVDFVRSLFCDHDWDIIQRAKYYEDDYDKRPYKYKVVYRCKKCGRVQRISM